MLFNKFKYFLLALFSGWFLAIILLITLSLPNRVGKAASSKLFASPVGSGNACTQSTPCPLSTALNIAANDDTIYLSQGVYTGTGFAVVQITKTVSLLGGWNGAPAGPILRDPQYYPSRLDGENTRQVIIISGNVTPTLDGLRIEHGSANSGGGIYVPRANLIIENCIIANNYAKSGGGVYFYQSNFVQIKNSRIYSNTAGVSIGGGLYTYQSGKVSLTGNEIYSNSAPIAGGMYISLINHASLTNNRIYGNTSSGSAWSNGGGLMLSQNPNITLTNNHIQNNTADKFGGGVFDYQSGLVLKGNLISGNKAAYGGGIYLQAPGDHPIPIDANTITGNYAQYLGGGAYLYGAMTTTMTMTNNIVADNKTDIDGSGIYIKGIVPRLIYNTIARNTGGNAAGISLSSAGVLLTNTIITSQTIGILVPGGCTGTLQATLWGSGAWANEKDWDGTGTILTGTINIWGNPDFANPDAGNYHIGNHSAAIDAGIDTGIPTDIDGDLRPLGSGFDLGADEHTIEHKIYLPLTLRNHSPY